MQNKINTFQPTRKYIVLEVVLIISISILCVILFSSLGRPIWIDEFLHFTFASFDTTTAAWNAIARTLSNINHGQTGIYILINYWLLQLFGADVLALRAPSLISAFLLCCFSAFALRIRGHGFAWQILAIFIIFCQSELMYFAGEARPYMPLAAATAGALLYYLASPRQRSTIAVNFVGWSSVLIGVLMHPYFSIYWLMIAAFGLWASWFNNEISLTASNIAKYLNFPLCIIGSFIYFALASQTWLTGSPVFDRNPFQFMHQSELLYLFIWQHTTFLGPNRGGEYFLIFGLIYLFIFIFIPLKIKNIIRSTIPPLVLIYLAFGISLSLSLLSYYQNYWILTRQWVASIGLVAIGFTWLCAEFMTVFIKLLENTKYKPILCVFFFSIAFYCWQVNLPKTKTLWAELINKSNTIVAVRSNINPPEKIYCPISSDTWVELANQNLATGAPVWNIFRYYYFSDKNPYCIE